jgi:photosystem II stability/assembly factor-like uncharacterized protein
VLALISVLAWLCGTRGVDAGANQWTSNGPEGVTVSAVAVDPQTPSTLYAGTFSGGVFKSIDAGGRWDPVNLGLTNLGIYALAIDPKIPTTLYAGTFGSGVFKSVDAGGRWDPVNSGLTNLYIRVLAIDPQTPSTLYAGTEDIVFRSTDGGASWSGGNVWRSCCTPDEGPRIPTALVVDPQSPTTLYLADYWDGVFKSLDGGATWSAANAGLWYGDTRYASLAIDSQAPATLYSGTLWRGVFSSADGGGSWSPTGSVGLHNPPGITYVAINPQPPTTLYAAGHLTGVFKSTDGGRTWGSLDTGLPDSHVTVLAIDPQDATILYAGTDSGVFSIQQDESAQNRPPLASAGPDQTAEATGPDGAVVSLDGSGSSDPDGDTLTYTWSWAAGSAEGIRPAVRVPLGTTEVTLAVSDPRGGTATDGVLITVRDTTPPAVALTSPGDEVTVSGTINLTATATDSVAVAGVQFLLDGAALGPEDTWAPYEVPWDTRTASDGTHRLGAVARDQAGNLATSRTVMVTVANGPISTLGLTRHEEASATLAPAGTWAVITPDQAGVLLSGSEAAYASAAGATATFTFTGTGVRWIGFPCEICGIADVLIDGARVATVDTFARGRPEVSTAVYTSPQLEIGSHTLVIQVTGTANTSSGGPYVVVDAIDVLLDVSGLAPPIPSAPTGLP